MGRAQPAMPSNEPMGPPGARRQIGPAFHEAAALRVASQMLDETDELAPQENVDILRAQNIDLDGA
eukprot:6727480-Lingulodinium_polyedra.AAC.1